MEKSAPCIFEIYLFSLNKQWRNAIFYQRQIRNWKGAEQFAAKFLENTESIQLVLDGSIGYYQGEGACFDWTRVCSIVHKACNQLRFLGIEIRSSIAAGPMKQCVVLSVYITSTSNFKNFV